MERCGLCLQPRKLKKSHLMPKSLHKAIRGDHGLVRASTTEGSIYTDKQAVRTFLCEDCEGMFSRKGERVVCKESYRGKGNFVLREKLREEIERFGEKDKFWIMPKTESSSLDYEAYLYFGASIIWRASAGNWPIYAGKTKGGLGKYEEKIRRYLVGQAAFPEKVFLIVGVNKADDDEEPSFNSVIVSPCYEKLKGYHQHTFYVPGISFVFIIGRMSGRIERLFRRTNTSVIFIEMPFRENRFFQTLPRKMLDPKGRLKEEVGDSMEELFKVRNLGKI